MKLFLNIQTHAIHHQTHAIHYPIDRVLLEATIILIADSSVALVRDSIYQNQPICL